MGVIAVIELPACTVAPELRGHGSHFPYLDEAVTAWPEVPLSKTGAG